jgi:hypothetical protein
VIGPFTDVILTVNVPAGGATATVTAADFTGCIGTDALAGTTVVATATGFPWEITTLGVPGNFVLSGIHVKNIFSNGATQTFEGNLNGTFNNMTHTAHFLNSTG